MSLIYPDTFPAERYRLNATLDVYKRRLERAKGVINDALSLGIRWYIAWSGGKDSTVLAHLVNSICPNIEIWSEKDDCDFPEEMGYIKSVAERYNFNLKIVTPAVSLWDEIEKGGIDICEDLHSRGTELSDTYFYSEVAKQEALFDGVFLGLRMEESRGRKWNFKKRGHIYQRSNKKWTCIPLAQWTATDIFSYLVINEIPILDIYYKTKFVNAPEEIRKAWYLPSARANKGFCVWLKYYYPELYNKLMNKFSEVKSYT